MIIDMIINYLLHLDKLLFSFIDSYELFVYPVLFSAVFLEMGIIIMPFLPGDSLIFAAGTLSGLGKLNFFYLFLILTIAAVFGDILNYHIGKKFANYIFKKNWVKKKYFESSHKLYLENGGKMIVFARFIPIVRTFVPFVAGASKMRYREFILYNIFGGIVWVIVFLLMGNYFVSIKFIQGNFSLVMGALVLLSAIVPFSHKLFKKFYRRENSTIN